jgi:acetyl-CoA synthetase
VHHHSGCRIGPSEIEEVLNAHPAVTASGVVGVPDEIRARRSTRTRWSAAVTTADDSLTDELRDRVRHRQSRAA